MKFTCKHINIIRTLAIKIKLKITILSFTTYNKWQLIITLIKSLRTFVNPYFIRWFNPLTAGAAYIRVFIFLSAHYVTPFEYDKDKMWHKSAIFENSWPPFCQIWRKFRLNNLAGKWLIKYIQIMVLLWQVLYVGMGGGPRVVVSTAAFHARVRGSVPGLGCLKEVACSASDRQGSNFESCVWRTVSSQSSHHPQEVLLAQFSLYVHKGGLKPDSFHLYVGICTLKTKIVNE